MNGPFNSFDPTNPVTSKVFISLNLNLGAEEAYKEMSTGLNEIVSTASAISKFIKIGEVIERN